MKKIDIENWERKNHYSFFSRYDNPFFNITAGVKCTNIINYAKEKKLSPFLCYLYASLKTANELENFKLRIVNKEVVEFNVINASAVVGREDNTFGFSLIKYSPDFDLYYRKALEVTEKVKYSHELDPSTENDGVIHYTTLPWIDFTSIQHPRSFGNNDSVPKITFGKIVENMAVKNISVNIEANHALMDGYHIGLFLTRFEELMGIPESYITIK